jgi:hypothetical protein
MVGSDTVPLLVGTLRKYRDRRQLVLTIPARETMGVREHLTAVLDNLPDDLVAEVRDFAEFLQQRQQQKQGRPEIDFRAGL